MSIIVCWVFGCFLGGREHLKRSEGHHMDKKTDSGEKQIVGSRYTFAACTLRMPAEYYLS